MDIQRSPTALTERIQTSSKRRAARVAGVVVLLLTLAVTWAIPGPGTALASRNNRAGASGELVLKRNGQWRELGLTQHPAEVDLRMNVSTDKVATGNGQSITIVARRVAPETEYRVRVRFNDDGAVAVSIARLLNGRRSLIAPLQSVAGLAHRPNEGMAMRVLVTGSQPATIAVKVWPAGEPQPADWSQLATDSSPELAGEGWLGLRFSLAASTTNVPVRYSYEALRLSEAPVEPPVEPTPTPTPTPPAATPTPTPPTLPTPQATPTPSDQPSPSPTATPPPPTAPPSPSPSPTATPPPPTAPPSPSPSPTATPSPTPTPSPTDPPVPPTDTYYVAPDGDDTNSGSISSPLRTLQRAADIVQPGKTVVLRAGTYAGFTLRRSGTATDPITFMAYTGEVPIVDGFDTTLYTIRLTAVRYVTLTGLTVQGGYGDRQSGGGISVENSSFVIVRNNVVRDNKSYGVRSYVSSNVVIDDNDIYGNAVGVHIGGGGAATVVSSNLIHENDRMMVNTTDDPGDDAGGEGVALVKSTGHVIVRDNYIWGNRAVSHDYGFDGGAFSIYAASNWEITGNHTWDNRNIMETGTDAAKTPCDGGKFTRNVNYGATTLDVTVGMVLRCASNMLVANNTFQGIQHHVFDISHNKGSWGGSIEGLRIINNVISISTGKIYGIESALPASVVIDQNLLHQAGPGPIATVMGVAANSLETFRSWTGRETQGIVADPRFMDVSGNDYRLQSSSPAIDSGRSIAGVTDGYIGSAPDRGAIEQR